MRHYISMLKRELSSREKLPHFPKKKILGNKEPEFLNQRKEAL